MCWNTGDDVISSSCDDVNEVFSVDSNSVSSFTSGLFSMLRENKFCLEISIEINWKEVTQHGLSQKCATLDFDYI